MKKKRILYLILTSFVCVGLVVKAIPVHAAEEGGQVQTQADVGFYEESTDSSTEPTTSETKPSQSISTPPRPVKPTGKFPTTGELVKKSLLFSGSALVLLALIFFFWKRKKEKKEVNSER
ncbi:hypothetical protein A5821_002048 [Enterococcus sp. 7F3_DIV0205]|uniref:Gram-positive cocci surface proteins LPxTG domain-containing protein n=1 Tax=Candidatus Enterococcus palustris TaxID=1834189 RepID=A0AAQ3WA40_9ENTE|nr:LPXTG cell wall anchor domain-containing protein [Enterococcus sp. 7F3_DIV0205]OTN82487.1 hypothetical protein A5821_002398 [Enterococcus sp. 7F3_DIV0205]